MEQTRSRSAMTPYIGLFVCMVTTSHAWAQTRLDSLHSGYLFIDGTYIPPPYDVRATSESIRINDREFPRDYFDLSRFESDGRMGDVRRGRRTGTMGRRERIQGDRGFRRLNPLDRISEEIGTARFGAVVVLYRKQKPLVLFRSAGSHQLLAALSGVPASESAEIPATRSSERQAIENRLAAEFEPTESFVSRVTAEFRAVDEVEAAGARTSASNLIAAKISYPLTVFAMVAVVLGFGHLLSNRPHQGDADENTLETRSVAVKTLSIIACFSAIDLVWTIAATNAGTMRELNPLGSHLIHDPAQLACFKLTLTAMSIGILYVLHRNTLAQVATWWCCLLLTLLTARWVVFQSMFV